MHVYSLSYARLPAENLFPPPAGIAYVGRVQCPFKHKLFRRTVCLLNLKSQGLLLAGILGGGQSVDTFKPGGGITAAKAYMTFVLAFVGLTSIIVSPSVLLRMRCCAETGPPIV
jgi:hypothetical protein